MPGKSGKATRTGHFLIGCSFTFETPLMQAGIDVRHISEDCNVPMYRTNRPCREAGRLKGELVVSMRPVPAHQVADAVTITARYPAVHGAPVHIGEPQALGIQDINKPDFGDPVTLRPRRNTSVLGLWRYPTGSSDGITGAICCKPCPPATCLSPIFRTPPRQQ